MGLLLSVAQPSGSNRRADLDYQALRIALQSDNITAAQQAYVRLQSDLLLFHSASAQPTQGSGVAGGSSQLNTTA